MKMRFATLAIGLALSLAPSLQAQNVATVISSNLFEPNSIAVGASDDVYITDASNNRLIKFVATTGATTVLAGSAGKTGTNNGTGSGVRFNQPTGIVSARGGLIIADSWNHTIRFSTTNGVVTTIAGSPSLYGGYLDGAGSSAQFSYPLGLAVDSAGNIYVADSGNNMIRMIAPDNSVSTYATGLYQPSGVAVAANGDVWVANTLDHTIVRVKPDHTWDVVAGASGEFGIDDSSDDALNARFNLPGGIFAMEGGTSFLITDTGNNTLRRLYFTNTTSTYVVETVAGQAGSSGLVDGSPLAARFFGPIGVAPDVVDTGFYIVDRGNNALRRLQLTPPQPPVSDPVLGWVDFPPDSTGDRLSQFNTVIQSVFNDSVIIAVKAETGVQTFITYGPTPTSPFNDTIPNPSPTTGVSPATYNGDKLPFTATAPSIVGPLPDLTIKAISVADGRRPSAIVSARYQFKVANPIIVGTNGYTMMFTDKTSAAAIWYTIDGSDPTNNPALSLGPVSSGDVFPLPFPTTNFTLKVRAFRDNFTPSAVVSQTLAPTNFVANNLTFGFPAGEASSSFIAAAGQRFYAPVTLTLLPGQKMYTLQFNATVTNGTGPAVGQTYAFQSMLEKPIVGSNPVIYETIPPAMFNSSTFDFDNLMFTNSSENLLGVGWYERKNMTNLYPTTSQDLITFSQAHDTLFNSSKGKVIVGGYSFVVPGSAANGDTYVIHLDRPSASADGINIPAIILAPTNGATKTVTVGSAQYVVGDVAPFRWFNAGDFGDNTIVSVDVLQTFQSAVYRFNVPPPGSDFFDAMDSADDTGSLDGNDTQINNIMFGNTNLDVNDIYVTYRRSLDPSLTWYARYWANGVRNAVPVANVGTGLAKPTAQPKASPQAPSGNRFVNVTTDDVQASAGSTIQIPVRASIVGNLPIRVMAMNIDVLALDGSPVIGSQVTFTPAAGLGAATLTSSQTTYNTAGAWLNSSATGVSGTNILGTLTVTIPTNAAASSAWKVHFTHLSVSPNGVGLFPLTVQDSLITTADRSTSSWNDGIPDSWRLRWFGSVQNLLSGANLDPDGDGHSNYQEFKAGTNPLDTHSLLNMNCQTSALTWPSVFGKEYSVECSSTLFGGSWSVIGTVSGTGQMMQFADPTPANGMRFYRVKVQ